MELAIMQTNFFSYMGYHSCIKPTDLFITFACAQFRNKAGLKGSAKKLNLNINTLIYILDSK
jgi:hypothetical protein